MWDNFWQLKSPLKMMKNAYYFHIKAVLVLKYSNFCLDFSFMLKNDLIRKIRSISRFMTWQPGKQTIVIHILPNISRSKSNQTMKFGQLIIFKELLLQQIKEIFLTGESPTLKIRKIHRKTPVSSLFFPKVADLRPAISLKKKLW